MASRVGLKDDAIDLGVLRRAHRKRRASCVQRKRMDRGGRPELNLRKLQLSLIGGWDAPHLHDF